MTTKPMNTAKSCFERILRSKPTMSFWLTDTGGDYAIEFSEKEYKAAQKVSFNIIPDENYVMMSEVQSNIPNTRLGDILTSVKQHRKVTLVKIRDELITLADFKKLKPEASFSVDLDRFIGYHAWFTPNGIRAGCQHHSWKEWKRSGTEIIDAYVRPDSKERARDLLSLVIENKQRLIDKLTLAEKDFQKRKKSIGWVST